MWIIKNGKSHLTRPIYYWGVIVILTSFALVIAGEFDTMLAWWLMIGLLLPALLLAFKTPYVALRTICGISFLTQFFTLPFFYLYRDKFVWGHVKPFNFTAIEAFPILAKVSLFLFSLIFFFRWLYPFTLIGGASNKIEHTNFLTEAVKHRFNKYASFDVRLNRNSRLFTVLIIMLIGLFAPLNLWLYSNGIGLTGVEPQRLPYRLSGILFYLTKYIIPLSLAYLYLNTKRGWFLMLILLSYAWVLGLCSVSKGAVLMIALPVLAFAWIDKRNAMLVVAGLGALIGVSVASGARMYVYTVTAGQSAADTSLSIFTLISNILSDPDNPMWNFDFLPLLFTGILGRIEGFENLVMAQFYDPNAVDGAWEFILRMIWKGLSSFNVDLHHIQWQGNVLPEGFNNGGALLSNAVIVGNSGLLWVVLSSIITAIYLIILEKSCKRISRKYVAFELISSPVIIYISFIFFSESGVGPTFVYPLILLLFVSWMPSISFKERCYN